MTTNLKSLATAALLATYLLAQNAHAGPVGPLTTFTAGTTAKASEVNGNFSAVSTAVNAHDSRITTLETNPSISGNITLVDPSTATAGSILKGTSRFIHNFGTANTFVGVNAGNFTMLGRGNTGVGINALSSNAGDGSQSAVGGINNTAIGTDALQLNTTGSANTASGFQALFNNTTGSFNTASGQSVLLNNTTGSGNTASGSGALASNTTGNQNTATGTNALLSNTTGSANTASGESALSSNTTGLNNTASGLNALQLNTTGSDNTATGTGSLKSNVTGSNNTASGFQALFNTTGNNNIALGLQAGNSLTTGNYNIDIGNQGVAAEGNTIRIGDSSNQTRTFIAGISGVTVAGAPVLVDSNGQLGVASSSRRVKDDIADMGEASGTLMKLRPVTFHYKSDKNPKGRTLQYGLVAEEVAKVAPGLVAHSADGKIETVYYQFLAPMLLNEMQKQQREIKVQAALLAKQSAEIAALKQQAERVAGLLDRLERADMRTAAAR